jgi:hypothetical protein
MRACDMSMHALAHLGAHRACTPAALVWLPRAPASNFTSCGPGTAAVAYARSGAAALAVPTSRLGWCHSCLLHGVAWPTSPTASADPNELGKLLPAAARVGCMTIISAAPSQAAAGGLEAGVSLAALSLLAGWELVSHCDAHGGIWAFAAARRSWPPCVRGLSTVWSSPPCPFKRGLLRALCCDWCIAWSASALPLAVPSSCRLVPQLLNGVCFAVGVLRAEPGVCNIFRVDLVAGGSAGSAAPKLEGGKGWCLGSKGPCRPDAPVSASGSSCNDDTCT